MKSTSLLRFFILSFLLVRSIGFSQSYSVTNVLQIIPPYSSYIPDYLDDFNTQLSVIITLNDIYEPQHQVKLKFKFEGENYIIETSDYANVPPITLSPGIPIVISGSQLIPYLGLDNLVFSGMDPNYYKQHKSLPEGPCNICVEVVDYLNPNAIIIGNLSCQSVWFSKYNPPILNLPFCEEVVPFTEPQFISFNWSPMHINFDLNQTTNYRFELFEIRPEGMDANVIVNSSLPYYSVETTNPFIIYSLTEPPLSQGMTYAWRVQAIDGSGRDNFKNFGYSEVCTFQYASLEQNILDELVISINSEGVSQRRGSAWWEFDTNVEGYQIDYRKSSGGSWFTSQITDNATTIKNLEPETSYDVRVRGVIGESHSEWSNVSQFTTEPTTNYACNSTIFPPIPPDFQPLPNLIKGDFVQIGQFEMEIKDAEELSAAGRYKGVGLIQVPFILLNLRVSFENILVDDEYVVREGEVLTITEGLDKWQQDNEIEDALDDAIDIPGVIDDIYVSDSTIIILVGEDTLVYDFENDPMVFVDEDGWQYAVFSDGTIVIEYLIDVSTDQLMASDTFKIEFSEDPNQVFGFDGYEDHFKSIYEAILLSDSTIYHVPIKSIGNNTTDYVRAILTCEPCDEDLVEFKTTNGIALSFEKIGTKEYRIQLENIANHTNVKAYYINSDIGKMAIKSYEEKEKDLTIVNLTTTSISQAEITDYLTTTFNQANIKWNIEYDNFSAGSLLGGDNVLESPDVTLMKKYSIEMRSIRDAYFASNTEISKNQYFLFVVPGFSKNNVEGYMVRGKSIGFIKSGSDPQVYAHELAHGLGGLKHTFPEEAQGSTENLMDYSFSHKLNHKQWFDLRNNVVINWFDDEEDGELVLAINSSGKDYYLWINEEPLISYEFSGFYTPGGKIVKFNDISQLKQKSLSFDPITGGLSRFNYGNQEYVSRYSRKMDNGVFVNSLFDGYVVFDFYQRFRDSYEEVNGDLEATEMDNISSYLVDSYMSSEDYFSEMSLINSSDFVIGYLNEEGSCNKNIVKWQVDQDTNTLRSIFNSYNRYNYPIQGYFKNLIVPNSTLGYSVLDTATIGFEADKESLICQLNRIYQGDNYFSKRLIEYQIYKGNSSSISDLINNSKEQLQDLLIVSKQVEDFGIEWYNSNLEAMEEYQKDLLAHALISIYSSTEQFVELQSQLNTLESRVNYFTARYDHLKSIIDQYQIASSNQDLALKLMGGLNAFEMKVFPPEIRMNILKTLNTGALYENGLFAVEESLVNSVFENIKEEDIIPFLDLLATETMLYNGNSQGVLDAFMSNMNGTLDFWDENYKTLISRINHYISYAYLHGKKYGNGASGDFSRNIFSNLYDPNYSGGINISDIDIMSLLIGNSIEDSPLGIYFKSPIFCQPIIDLSNDVVVDKYNIKKIDFNEIILNTISVELEKQTYTFHPFEIIFISVPKSKSSVFGLAENQIYQVPALYLKYLKDLQIDHTHLQQIEIAATLISLTVGGVGVVQAIRAGRYATALLETADFILEVSMIDPNNLTGWQRDLAMMYQVCLGSASSMGNFSSQNYSSLTRKIANNEIQMPTRQNLDEFLELYNARKAELPADHYSHKYVKYLEVKGLLNGGGLVNNLEWLDDLETSLGNASRVKIQSWIDEGLDVVKLKNTFDAANNKSIIYNNLNGAKSIYHQRVLIEDYLSIPGVVHGQYITNSVDNISNDLVRSIEGKNITIYQSQTETFANNLPPVINSQITVIEDLGNGIQFVKINPGTKLYRVFDGYQPWDNISRTGNTLPNGSYWTLNKPTEISSVIGGAAVMPEWNGMSKVIEIEVPEGGLYSWFGSAAKQPASSQTNTFFLNGGEPQLIISFEQNQIIVSQITSSIKNAPWTN